MGDSGKDNGRYRLGVKMRGRVYTVSRRNVDKNRDAMELCLCSCVSLKGNSSPPNYPSATLLYTLAGFKRPSSKDLRCALVGSAECRLN